jgi:hypothetical protein
LMICAHLKNTFFCLHLFSFFVVVVFFTKLTHTHIHTEPFIYIIYFSCFCTILYGRQLNPSSDLFLSFLCLRKKNLMKGNGTYCTVNLTICQKTHQIWNYVLISIFLCIKKVIFIFEENLQLKSSREIRRGRY